LRNLFWISINDRLNLWRYEKIGIREGRKVVIVNNDFGSFQDFLKRLLDF